MGTIRERIEAALDQDFTVWGEWKAGNLIPADDGEALFAAICALSGERPPRPASEMRQRMEAELRANPAFVPADEVEARIREAVAKEQERCFMCQPPTNHDPDETPYDRGFFDAVQQFAAAIRKGEDT